MRLLLSLVLQVAAAVLLCLTVAAAWVMFDSKRSIETEARHSALRVIKQVKALSWRELTWRGSAGRDAKYAFPDWRSADVLRVISPGYCVSLAWAEEAPQRLCGRGADAEAASPRWFARLYDGVFGAAPPVAQELTLNGRTFGTVTVEADPAAALQAAWHQVSVVIGVAAAMAAGIGLLVTLVIGNALRPAGVILRGLRRLELGDLSARLPPFSAREFNLIGRAFNDLSERLARTTAERANLTRRLFMVQEEERRALARDLHDEFGQCLTAAGALSAAIVKGTHKDRPDIAEDARELGLLAKRMMGTLRGALSRLRPPEFDELGLEGSLNQLVASWNARTLSRSGQVAEETRAPTIRLDIAGSLVAVPTAAALSIYRVTQECLTNVARHTAATEVLVRVECETDPARILRLTVEDDGGGAPDQLNSVSGHGILGIRERITALGGSLAIGRARAGLRIAALIPLGPSIPVASAESLA
ncbi:sensor histidine kinase [Methylobacterium organophilum]|uniref:HAMP domain-containing protein n=1 Tax=Methylobacterium organophilum TaxID=410 RepID=A0ABQ4T885_METOR|nr:histidine kinase [Methylobacterium organophilum]GJE27828.1 hypothetical protein LKMONMHP_2690 [Methylobacterium organophilum]